MIRQVILAVLVSIGIFLLAFHIEVGGMGIGSNLNALMIVLGGTLSATLIAYPWKRLLWTGQLLKKAFQPRDDGEWTINTLVSLAKIYRQGGIRALEAQGNRLQGGLIRTAVELITYQCSRDKIEQLLQKEVQLTCNQYEMAHKILHNMARLAPALGLCGTIVNLIRVFGHISDPQSLIGYMGIALLSTFYGVVLANLCFVPLTNKLREFMDYEEMRLNLVQEGVLDLYDQENPRAIQYKLDTLSTTVLRPGLAPARSKLILVAPGERTSSVKS
jgi:chemotaxis protein MotA